jgi:hypothetical protein
MSADFYCVTRDRDNEPGEKLQAHGPYTEEGANAFEDGVEFANKGALESLGVFRAASQEKAIEACKAKYWEEHGEKLDEPEDDEDDESEYDEGGGD